MLALLLLLGLEKKTFTLKISKKNDLQFLASFATFAQKK